MASRRRRGGSDMDSSFGKWKKILQGVNSMKMSEDSTDYLDGKKLRACVSLLLFIDRRDR